MADPKMGDKIRITFEGVLTDRPNEHFRWSERPEGATVSWSPGDSRVSIEILERADDPSKDPVGTIRAELDDSAVYVKTQDRRWTRVSSRSCEGGFSFAENEMGMSKVIGAVPGTTAAERQ